MMSACVKAPARRRQTERNERQTESHALAPDTLLQVITLTLTDNTKRGNVFKNSHRRDEKFIRIAVAAFRKSRAKLRLSVFFSAAFIYREVQKGLCNLFTGAENVLKSTITVQPEQVISSFLKMKPRMGSK